MIVVADSGSTKTEWRLCSKDKVLASENTAGLNPLALDKGATISELRNSDLSNWIKEGVETVHFYSAGIIDDAQKAVASGNLRILFKEANIEANSDLLGAARAVFGTNEGVIGILGTGSNTGIYDGKEIIRSIPALGYILADEGSGSVLGRTLIRHFLRNELSEDLSTSFKSYYQDFDSIVETIYAEKHAGRFLASFVPFLYEHKDEPFVRELLLKELEKFIKLIGSYGGHYKIGIVGSVGFQFQTELNLLANNIGISIVDYLKNPIDKLTSYHQETIE